MTGYDREKEGVAMGFGFRITNTVFEDMTVPEQIAFLANMLRRENIDATNLPEILEQAARNGIDLNEPLYDFPDKPCFVHLAGNPAILDALVAAGADIAARDDNGRTALHYAADQDDEVMIGHLSEKYPALLSIADNKGNYPVSEEVVFSEAGAANPDDSILASLEKATGVEWRRTALPLDGMEMVMPNADVSKILSDCARLAGVEGYADVGGQFHLIQTSEESMAGFLERARSALEKVELPLAPDVSAAGPGEIPPALDSASRPAISVPQP